MVNISPVSPLGQSSKVYDQLKNKISTLEGRLVDVKKNFELSFKKKTNELKTGKEKTEGSCLKFKNKFQFAKNSDKNKLTLNSKFKNENKSYV